MTGGDGGGILGSQVMMMMIRVSQVRDGLMVATDDWR